MSNKLDKFLENIKGKRIMDIVSMSDYLCKVPSITYGDYEANKGKQVILLNDGSAICVWTTIFSNLNWYKISRRTT